MSKERSTFRDEKEKIYIISKLHSSSIIPFVNFEWSRAMFSISHIFEAGIIWSSNTMNLDLRVLTPFHKISAFSILFYLCNKEQRKYSHQLNATNQTPFYNPVHSQVPTVCYPLKSTSSTFASICTFANTFADRLRIILRALIEEKHQFRP